MPTDQPAPPSTTTQHHDPGDGAGMTDEVMDGREAAELVIVTGMSGAGRSTTANVLEDSGWYVIDNLPPQLLVSLADLADGGPRRATLLRLAAVVDVRARGFFADLQAALDELRSRGWRPNLVFLDATDE